MFKKIPMGLAALTFFGVEAVSLNKFSKWNPDISAVQTGVRFIEDYDRLVEDSIDEMSRPACNSADGCKTDTAAAPLFA